MKKIGVTLGLLLAFALAASATASQPSPADFKNRSKYCKALRAEMGAQAFGRAFGTNGGKSNAHGKCVSRKGRIDTVVEPSPPPTACTPEAPCSDPQPVFAFGGTEPASKHPGNGQGKNKSK